MHTVDLDPFPPGNPFHNDAISVGMDLQAATTNRALSSVYVMSSGMNLGYDFYIVDSQTGQRIGIKLDRSNTTESERGVTKA